MRKRGPHLWTLSLSILLSLFTQAWAIDQVVFKRNNQQIEVEGRVLVTAADGGLLLLAPSGRLWSIVREEIITHKTNTKPFKPVDPEAMAQLLISELPSGFKVYTTAHYVICFNTSHAYAQWSGALFERLYRAFTNYWNRRGLKLQEPEFPLVALVLADYESYRQLACTELGNATRSVVGYYNLQSNRITTFDLTGTEAMQPVADRHRSAIHINRILSRPGAEPLVATVIHEATHQLAFNCGLQARYADIPLWLSEGIALYFETPDLESSRGWRRIGVINRPRLNVFMANLKQRPTGFLVPLIANDKQMRDHRTAPKAYADAWAINYYLIQHHPHQYLAYVKMLSTKKPLLWDSPETRLMDFKHFFGNDLTRLEDDLTRQMQRIH